MSSVRVLALDHFFDQDLRALEAHPQLAVRRFPYQRLRGPAVRCMGKAVARGLRAYNDPRTGSARGRYAAWLASEMRTMYLERAFDVVVLPSDTFFYVRTLPAAVHRLGIPTVVVQKETTISRATMALFSAEIGDEAPFVSDFMTVCSARQREFWERAGVDATCIEVTGQPRFDVYASPAAPSPASRRRVLFLSYSLDAYVVEGDHDRGRRTWEPMRDATEAALLQLVRAGRCEVIVKCHPQQSRRAEATRLATMAGTAWNRGVSVADEDADTRELIMGTDTVVGFQTTALYEAVAARKRVIYAAWGPAYERYRAGLIPFHEAPATCLRHAFSPETLTSILTDDQEPANSDCRAWYEAALGPIDGHATDRVAERLATVAAAGSATGERRSLDRRRRRFALGFLARSIAAEAVWTAATPVAKLAGEQRRVAIRQRRSRESRLMAVSALRGRGARGAEPSSDAER
jgi:hypothetical protein